MGRKPPLRSPLLRAAPRFPVRVAARPRPRQRLRDKLTSVQLWVAIAGIVGSLMSVPALIISMNALEISEKQLADAQRLKAETDLASQRAFVQRVSVDVQAALVNRAPIVISNGNTTSTEVEVYLGFNGDSDASPGAWEYQMVMFAAPACSQATYRTSLFTKGHFKVLDVDNARYSLDLIVFNPIDQRRWRVGSVPEPLSPNEEAEYREKSHASTFPHPGKNDALPGCV